jgi:SPP1 gp7 family putative phage head morphogenesis protein
MKKINAETLQGILQGESMDKIAKRLRNVQEMNKTQAIRSARTIVTGAENKGRQDSYERAEKDGIQIMREWIATNDNRTRHWHSELDGTLVGVDEHFENAYGKIMFPGDPAAHPANTYNCRCTLVAKVNGFKKVQVQKAMAEKQLEEPQTTTFTPAKTTEEAQQYADRFVSTYKSSLTGAVDYSGIDVAYANEMNRAFTEVFDAYDTRYPLRNIKPFNMREKRFKGTTAEAAYQWGAQDMFYNKAYYKTQKAFSAHAKQAQELLDHVLPNLDSLIAKYENDTSFSGKKTLSYLKAMKKTGRSNVYMADAYGTTIHEMGHYLDDSLFHKMFSESGFDLHESFSMYSGGISGYATSSKQEYIAESFAAYWKGETDIIDPDLLKIFEGAKKK